MKKMFYAGLVILLLSPEDGVCKGQIFSSANSAIAGATNSGKSTISQIGNLATDVGNALQNILGASQKTMQQVQDAKKQFDFSKKGASFRKKSQRLLKIWR